MWGAFERSVFICFRFWKAWPGMDGGWRALAGVGRGEMI